MSTGTKDESKKIASAEKAIKAIQQTITARIIELNNVSKNTIELGKYFYDVKKHSLALCEGHNTTGRPGFKTYLIEIKKTTEQAYFTAINAINSYKISAGLLSKKQAKVVTFAVRLENIFNALVKSGTSADKKACKETIKKFSKLI